MEIEVRVGEIDGPLGDDEDVLSARERMTIARLRNERDRRRHVAGRSIVRRRLAAERGLAPGEIPIAIASGGRPSAPFGPAFSIAHSGSLVLVAFAPCAVGVDVEPFAELDELDTLIALYASPHERAALRAMPPHRRARAFLTMWVRKEAVVKGCGVGLDADLSAIDASRDVVAVGGRAWRIETLSLSHRGYAAAVAYPERTDRRAAIRIRPALIPAGWRTAS